MVATGDPASPMTVFAVFTSGAGAVVGDCRGGILLLIAVKTLLRRLEEDLDEDEDEPP